MKKSIALVLVLAFLNLVIMPEFASAVVNGLEPLAIPTVAVAGPIILGTVLVIAGLVYLATRIAGQKTKQPEEQKPEDINRNIENLQPRSENDSLETTLAEQKPGDPNQTIVNLRLRTESDSVEITYVSKLDKLPAAQLGELVILEW